MPYIKLHFVIILIFLFSLFLISPHNLFSQEYDKSKIIKVADEALWEPFSFEKSGKPTRGIALELAEEIFSNIGAEFEMELLPQKRLLRDLEEGNIDMVVIWSKNSRRELYCDYTVPIFEERGLIFYSDKRFESFEWGKFSDLVNYRIGIVDGYNYGEEFINASEEYNFKIEKVTSNKQNFEKLRKGRIDLVMTTESTALDVFRRNPEYFENVKTAEKPYIIYSFCSAFSKKSGAGKLIPEINSVILRLRKEGTIKKIFEKYSVEYREPE